MLNVKGVVTVRSSQEPLSNLMVVAYHTPDHIDPRKLLDAGNLLEATARLPRASVRLGSTTTDASGRFVLRWEGAELQRLQLVLLVSAESSATDDGALLYVSPVRAVSLPAVESFIIRVEGPHLDGVDDDFHRPGGEAAHRAVVSTLSSGRALATVRSSAAAAIKRVRETHARSTAFREELLQHITARARAGSRRFVNAEQPVRALNREVIDEGISRRFTAVPRRSRYYLTSAQRDALPPSGSLARSDLDQILGIPKRPRTLLRSDEVAGLCRSKTTDEQAVEQLLGLSDDEPGSNGGSPPANGSGDVGGSGVEDTIQDGIPAFVARMMDHATAPEDSLIIPQKLKQRPSQDDVRESVRALEVPLGPADKPAYFDFHQLQIAFDHVWDQLVDEDVLELAELAFERVTDLGGDPGPADNTSVAPLDRLAREIRLIERTHRSGDNASIVYMRRRNDDYIDDYPNGHANGGSEPPPRPGGLDDFTRPSTPTDAVRAPTDSPATLLARLRALLNQKYAFTIFGKHAVNFGLIVTYRQKWEPVAYQAGDLVKTITLAPKESRTFTRKRTVRHKRSEREVAKSSEIKKDELNQTSRAEAEIVRKASAKTNFSLTSEGTYNFLVAEGSADTTIGRDAAEDSSNTKKDFREAVIKASNEYRNERTVEVSTELSEEQEEVESGQITNPNDELAVTFLFYELQRRFRVHEEIHRVTPVVLVAQDVPKPSDITEAWLIAHDWALKRALLDDTFRPALDYLSLGYEGDRLALSHLRTQLSKQNHVVDRLTEQLTALKKKEARAYDRLQGAIEERASQVQAEDTDGFWSDVKDFFGGDGQSPEAARILEDAARDALQRAAEEVKSLTMKLERELSNLNEVSERYQRVLQAHNNKLVQIARLKLHIKQNILHYMKAIWLHEESDQRFFRLFDVDAPAFADDGTAYSIHETTGDRHVIRSEEGATSTTAVDFEVTPSLTARFDDSEVRPLIEIADLDAPLGFKGNYMIFPLRESNALTDIMMEPYVDAAFGRVVLRDPDELGNMSRSDFARYVQCLHEELSEDEFNEIRDDLREEYERILQASIRQGEEIIVPTGSLFIEALPATHPLLEDFKLAHRAVDVKKAQAEARQSELENVRLAARLLDSGAHPDLLEDPDVEKKVVIEGSRDVVVTPDS